MKRASLACAISIAALASSGSGARAWDGWHSPSDLGMQRVGDWYLGAMGAAGALKFPTLGTYNVFLFGTQSVLGAASTRHVTTAAGGGLQFGHVLRDGTLPPWMGSRVRIGVEGFYRAGSSREQSSVFAGPNVQIEAVNMNLLGQDVLPGINFGVSQAVSMPFTMSSRIESSAFELALRARSDFTLRPWLTLTPSIGVFGGRTTDDYDIATFIDRTASLGTVGNPTSIDARQRTWRFGGDVGAEMTLRADTGIAFHVGGRFGVNYLRTSLDASDCISINFSAAPGTPCLSAPLNFTSSLSTSRNTIGYRAAGNVGASFNLFYALVSIGGFVSYDSKTPIFQTQTVNTGGGNQTGSPAGIRFVGAVSYGGYASIRMPFGL